MNHKLRRAVTALAIGNLGKLSEAATGRHARDDLSTGGCCDTNPNQEPRSHDTSRIAWAKLMARQRRQTVQRNRDALVSALPKPIESNLVIAFGQSLTRN